MANTPDLATCLATDEGRSELLPLSPFNALHYHFGMLLGVDDFETEQAYHRAKLRLHNAWLHREGVVWGFGVKLDLTRGEIRVTPGLALDAAGHELHLEADGCVNLAEWFEKHKEDADFKVETAGNTKKFDAHVVIRFKACLTRQVPALMEPCDNAGSGTAYSRVFETVEILLLPNQAPQAVYPYHRLRLMFGLDEPKTVDQAKLDELKAKETSSTGNSPEDQALLEEVRRDQAVLDEVARIQALAAAHQPVEWLRAFHRFAALDEIDLQPAKSEDGARTLLFPGQEDDFVVLANINGATLTRNNDGWVLTGGTLDTSVRPSHVATTTIQDLLCGRLMSTEGSTTPADSGPRVDPSSVILLTPKSMMFTVDKELQDASVRPVAFSVTCFEQDKGWRKSNVVSTAYGGGETKTVNLELRNAVSGHLRLIVYGTGPTPILGADLVPLAGAIGGPSGTRHDGHDFVYMWDAAEVEVKDAEVKEEPAIPDYKNYDRN